jgi:hypothetical protein
MVYVKCSTIEEEKKRREIMKIDKSAFDVYVERES